MIIGVTGGIASGKSTVCRVFEEQGAKVISADNIGREVVEQEKGVLDIILKAFGFQILQADGTLDRRKLGRIVFSDPQHLEKLNSIVHPPLLRRLRKRIDTIVKSSPLDTVVVDAALLVEWNILSWFDIIIAVISSPEVQMKRLVEQVGLSPEEARERIESQIPSEKKAALAHYVIINDSDEQTLRENSLCIWRSINICISQDV